MVDLRRVPVRFTGFSRLAALLTFSPQTSRAQDFQAANCLLDRRIYVALTEALPNCIRGEKRGCDLDDINSCYSMSMLDAAPDSLYREVRTAFPYSRKA